MVVCHIGTTAFARRPHIHLGTILYSRSVLGEAQNSSVDTLRFLRNLNKTAYSIQHLGVVSVLPCGALLRNLSAAFALRGRQGRD
eukprot:5262738-Pyramimonas_sp.AAC.1